MGLQTENKQYFLVWENVLFSYFLGFDYKTTNIFSFR
jgi:hypothetical protein